MTDLYNELKKYGDSDFYPFHMPGHKRNKTAAGEALAGAYGIDITEIDGFDNLHHAQGLLRRQQEEAAGIYGSDMTCFMINGSTGGILSAIAACTGKGGRLLMARNCHKSVYHAVYLQELQISYLHPGIIMPYGIADAVAPEAVEEALRAQPDIMAVIVTSPTYEGIVADIGKIADIAHRYGKPLIVDEAHGAHFGFHEAYPESSVELGADIVIHSLHKTLPAMTQTALVHINGNIVDRERVKRYLRIFQTSSPSYVLMASIDSCMELVKRESPSRLDMLINNRCRLLEKIKGCRYIQSADARIAAAVAAGLQRGQAVAVDPCKLVLYVPESVMTGQQLYDILRSSYHLQLEMAAGNYALGIITMMDTKEGFDRLADALLGIDKEIARQIADKEKTLQESDSHVAIESYNDTGRTVMTIAQAYEEEAEEIYLSEAEERVAAEFINLYPPGIPLVVPGERLDCRIIDKITQYDKRQMNIQGMTDKRIRVIKTGQNI